MAVVHVSIIVAKSITGVIGNAGEMPWKQGADLRRFRSMTWGKPVIMGRKTYESIGQPLPGRTTYVVTRNADYAVSQGVHVCGSLEEAIKAAKEHAAGTDYCEVCILGGGDIYRQAMKLADYLLVTDIHATVVGDTVFPEIKDSEWRLFFQADVIPAGPRDTYASIYKAYARKQ